MSKNKLHTLGYFRKRLRDENIESRILTNEYPITDKRKWTICINKDMNIFCTCMKNVPGETENNFIFSDLGQHIKMINFVIKTDSLNVIIKFLNSIFNNTDSKDYLSNCSSTFVEVVKEVEQ